MPKNKRSRPTGVIAWPVLEDNLEKWTIEQRELGETWQIINMDELLVTFDSPPNRTVHSIGEKIISMLTTRNEKTSFTCVLACA
ncbi:hypothetical protein X975_24155, partial [Stegodyphus mimosarum]